jgi:bacillithiol system protein YtxJ
MGWKRLEQLGQLETIAAASAARPQLLFKHSTRCSISAAAKHRLDGGLEALNEAVDAYYLDLIAYREISNEIARKFGVHHESPQVILIENGQATYNASHYDIQPKEILQNLASHNG